MKKIIIKIILISITILFIIGLINKINTLNLELSYSINNEKAYAAENSYLQEQNLVFLLTIDDLRNSKDSLMIEMRNIINENGFKDSQIHSLQYQLEHFEKTDTLILRDTVFRDPSFRLDTCIVDEWNRSCISLAYPGQIGISNSYVNEKYIIVTARREPIRPHRCAFVNFFRKKHTVLEIDVIDKNPYVETERQRFIEIID